MIRNVWEMFSDPAYALALDFAGVKVPCTACGRPIPDRSAPSWFSWADDIWSNPPAILHGGLYWAIRDDALDTVTSRIGNLLTEPTRFASFRHFGNGQTKPLLNYRGPGYHTVVNTRRIALRFPTYTGP